MCNPTRCRTCGKTTWSGCGRHVDSVKARVPAHQWCSGHQAATADPGSTPPKSGWLRRFLDGGAS